MKLTALKTKIEDATGIPAGSLTGKDARGILEQARRIIDEQEAKEEAEELRRWARWWWGMSDEEPAQIKRMALSEILEESHIEERLAAQTKETEEEKRNANAL